MKFADWLRERGACAPAVLFVGDLTFAEAWRIIHQPTDEEALAAVDRAQCGCPRCERSRLDRDPGEARRIVLRYGAQSGWINWLLSELKVDSFDAAQGRLKELGVDA